MQNDAASASCKIDERFCSRLMEVHFWKQARTGQFVDYVSDVASKKSRNYVLVAFKWALPILAIAWSAVVGMALYNIDQMNRQLDRMDSSIYELHKAVITLQTSIAEKEKYDKSQNNRRSDF